MSLTRCRPPLTNWDLTLFGNIFFSLKLPSLLSNITKWRLACSQNRSVLTNFGLMIYITIIDYRLFILLKHHRDSDWTFKIKQGWETHTKGLSQILPNKSRWILPFFKVSKNSWDFCTHEITFLTHLINLLEN